MNPSHQKLNNKQLLKSILIAPVIVGALGYFVDIYDLVLFSIVRVQSLKSLGLSGEALLTVGVRLINMQMMGMLLGGILWGILGDKKGRISVLFGSIFLYSSANIANAFVTNVEMYAWLRLIAGIGLAGELGAAITLVLESLPKTLRGYGTTLIATIGVSGALLASEVGERVSWNTAYIIGGILGFLLLLLRINLKESFLFESVHHDKDLVKGNFFALFTSFDRFKRYITCIFIGVPIWYVAGILMTFSPEITKSMGVIGDVTGGKSIFYSYLGLALGDVSAGLLSQKLKSRKKALSLFLLLTTLAVVLYFSCSGVSASLFYGACTFLGFSTGFWALFVTIAAEQFGTNLRATVAITVPNFVRGAVIPFTLIFRGLTPEYGNIKSAMATGVVALLLAWFGVWKIEETFHKDLNHLET